MLALGAESHINAVGDTERGVVGEDPDHVAAHPREKLGVGDNAGAARLPFNVVEEDQVDVRAVVEFFATELA